MSKKYKYILLEVDWDGGRVRSCKVKNQLTEEIINITNEMVDVFNFVDIHDLEVDDEFIKNK